MIREVCPNITDEDVLGIINGDEASTRNILNYYWPMIIARATVTRTDEAGNPARYVDEDLAGRQEQKLLEKIQQFRDEWPRISSEEGKQYR